MQTKSLELTMKSCDNFSSFKPGFITSMFLVSIMKKQVSLETFREEIFSFQF